MVGIRLMTDLWIPALLLGLWRFVPQRPLPKWVVGSSFAIYVLHSIVYRCLDMVFDFSVENAQQMVAKWIIGVSVSVLVAAVIRRYSPKFASLAFGGR